MSQNFRKPKVIIIINNDFSFYTWDDIFQGNNFIPNRSSSVDLHFNIDFSSLQFFLSISHYM